VSSGKQTDNVATLIFGLALIVGYVAFGVFCARKTWSWSAGLSRTWARVALVSTVVVLFFMPGVIGGGHGAGLGPAWLMVAGGTFKALTAASKWAFLLEVLVVWVVVFAIGLFFAKGRGKSDWRRDNPF